MEVFLSMKKGCRRRELLAHFNETLSRPDSSHRSPNCCDNCSGSLLSSSSSSSSSAEDKLDVTSDAKLILQSIRDCKGYYGLGVPCAVLKGMNDKSVKDYLKALSIFGQGKHRSKSYWMALGRSLTADGYVDEKQCSGTGRFSFTAFQISVKGDEFLDGMGPDKIEIVPTKELRETVVVAKSALAVKVAAIEEHKRSDPKRMSLLNEMTDTRMLVARKMNVAPYMVFSEEILSQLSVSSIFYFLSVN